MNKESYHVRFCDVVVIHMTPGVGNETIQLTLGDASTGNFVPSGSMFSYWCTNATHSPL